VAEAGIGITQEMGDKWAEGMMVALLAACRLWQGRTDVARELAERAKGLFVNIDDAFGQGQSGIALAWALALTGHATEAIEQAERAIAASQAAPGIYGTVVMGAACVLGTIGYTDRAQELLESELADWDWDDPGVKVSAANWGAGAGLVALQRGEPSEVLAMLRRAWAREIEDGVQANVGSVLSLVATAAGDPELGREAAGRTLTMAAGTYADRIRASLGDAFARLRLGDRAGAIDSLEAGRKLADGSEDRVHQGLVRLAEGHLLARLGRADADEALAEARRWLEELEVRTEGWDRAFALLSGD
jgi:tetratricopeptide (TPR) repeat protein